MGKLRIMSHNVWKNDTNLPAWKEIGADCSAATRAKGMVQVYTETNPDIIGFQEMSQLMADEIIRGLESYDKHYTLIKGGDTPIMYRQDRFELVDSDFLLYPTEIPNFEGEFNIVVPTGNFGNILAAYYAKKMGVPVGKLICASNANNVLTDFINDGTYDRNRDFYATISPSMDILISSNLERMLFELCLNDDKKVSAWQNDLSAKGSFTVDENVRTKMSELFWGGCCNDTDTVKTIEKYFKEYGYLCDTHTAVALNVYEQYVKETGDDKATVIASTASPYKFAKDVYKSLTGKAPFTDDTEALDALSALTGVECPAPLASVTKKTILHSDTIDRENMSGAVLDFIEA